MWLLIAVVATGCRKDKASGLSTTVKGSVLEPGSDKPVPFARVWILRAARSVTGSYEPVISTLCTSGGEYELHFDAAYSGLYYLVAEEKLHYEVPLSQSVPLQEGEVNHVNFYLTPFAWVKVHINNTTPYDQHDKLFLFIMNGESFYGNNIHLSHVFAAKGGIENEVKEVVTKNNATTVKYHRITVAPYDTAEFSIAY